MSLHASATPLLNERLDFRIDVEKKQLIARAAAIKGLSITDFAITTLCREAEAVVRSDETLVLSDRDRDAFLAALDNPLPPNAKLQDAAKRYRNARKSGMLR